MCNMTVLLQYGAYMEFLAEYLTIFIEKAAFYFVAFYLSFVISKVAGLKAKPYSTSLKK